MWASLCILRGSWGSGFGFINEVYRVIWQPERYSRADVSSITVSSGCDSIFIKRTVHKNILRTKSLIGYPLVDRKFILYHHSFVQFASLYGLHRRVNT